MNPLPTCRRSHLALTAVGVGLCVAAFLWGNYLLGPVVGVAYVLFSGMLLWLVSRSRTQAGSWSRWQLAVSLGLTVVVVVGMANPTLVSQDFGVIIDKYALDRKARAELAAVFASDPAGSELSVSVTHTKAVLVYVDGSVPSHNDLDRLHDRIARECPAVGRCGLSWHVTLRDTGRRIHEQDGNLYPAGKRPLPTAP